MKRNTSKIKAKKAVTMQEKTVAKIFEIAYLAGCAHYNSKSEWTPKDTDKMQKQFNKFISQQPKQKPKKPAIILPPNIVK